MTIDYGGDADSVSRVDHAKENASSLDGSQIEHKNNRAGKQSSSSEAHDASSRQEALN